MSNGIETVDIIDPWIYSTLANDAQMTAITNKRIWNGLGPASDGVYVLITLESVLDIATHEGQVTMVNAIYQIKAVARGSSYDVVKPAAKRAHALLHRPGEVVTTATGSLSCVRDGVIQMPESIEGVQYRHLGGRYRILAHSL